MTRDSDYFRRRAEEARAAACRGRDDSAEIDGDLALAYAALARRNVSKRNADAITPAIPLTQPA